MDESLFWLIVLVGIFLLIALYGLIQYLFPPRCEKCGKRYNHQQHEECPYCVPLRRPSILDYALPGSICMFFVGLGMMFGDGWIIGCGVALFVAIVVSTQKRIPWDEIWSKRVWVLFLVCVGIVVFFGTQQ